MSVVRKPEREAKYQKVGSEHIVLAASRPSVDVKFSFSELVFFDEICGDFMNHIIMCCAGGHTTIWK